jgi:TolA-binding protein
VHKKIVLVITLTFTSNFVVTRLFLVILNAVLQFQEEEARRKEIEELEGRKRQEAESKWLQEQEARLQELKDQEKARQREQEAAAAAAAQAGIYSGVAPELLNNQIPSAPPGNLTYVNNLEFIRCAIRFL